MAIQRKTLREDINTNDANRDPLTGEPGAHPIGTGIGAAGAASAGAIIGSSVGPIGTATGAVIGAIAGGIVGGFAGSGIAEIVNPTEEEDYWRENYASRPYVTKEEPFDTYQPAYRYGYDARVQNPDRTFDEVRNDLQNNWEREPENRELEWKKAEGAVRDAYIRTGNVYTEKLDSGVNSQIANPNNPKNKL